MHEFSSFTEQVYQTMDKLGEKQVNATDIYQYFGSLLDRVLLGLLYFTGCDSDSSYLNRDKDNTLYVLFSCIPAQVAFAELGSSWIVSEKTFTKISKNLFG